MDDLTKALAGIPDAVRKKKQVVEDKSDSAKDDALVREFARVLNGGLPPGQSDDSAGGKEGGKEGGKKGGTQGSDRS